MEEKAMSDIGRIFITIRRLFCRHQWEPTRFQALGLYTSFKCTKCGMALDVLTSELPKAMEKTAHE